LPQTQKHVHNIKEKKKKNPTIFLKKLPRDKGGVLLALNSNTYTIDEKVKKVVNKYKKNLPKDKGGMLLAPNPKTCT